MGTNKRSQSSQANSMRYNSDTKMSYYKEDDRNRRKLTACVTIPIPMSYYKEDDRNRRKLTACVTISIPNVLLQRR